MGLTNKDGNTTRYTYDGLDRITQRTDEEGGVATQTFDADGRLIKTVDEEGAETSYVLDACGRIVETIDALGNSTLFEYDPMGRLTKTSLHRVDAQDKVDEWEITLYEYDGRGLVTKETNALGAVTAYTYDGNGNLVSKTDADNYVTKYTYNALDFVTQINYNGGKQASYRYNKVGELVEDTWKIAKNGYGYHDVDAGLDDADPSNGRGGGGSNGNGNGNGNGQGNGNGSGDKPTGSLVTNFSTVVKQFVVDYTSPTFEPLMEHEVNGLDYRYVYGNDRLSVNITGVETSSGNLIENGNQIRLYYHMDYLGTTDYLTSPVSLKVTSWTHYNEWGEITHNAVLKTGKRELDLVKRYATHDYDAVLGMYYAKARFYDAENRRFAAMNPVKGEITNPLTMVQYIYVIDCPLVYVDVAGERVSLNPNLAGGGGSVTPKPTTDKAPIPKPAPLNGYQSSEQLTVTANQVRMRTGPGLNYSTIGSLNKGDKVINLKQTVDQDGYTWRKVQVMGKVCWVADHYLGPNTGISTPNPSEPPMQSPDTTAQPEQPKNSIAPPSPTPPIHKDDSKEDSLVEKAVDSVLYGAEVVIGGVIYAVGVSFTATVGGLKYAADATAQAFIRTGELVAGSLKHVTTQTALSLYSYYSGKSYYEIYTCDGIHTGFSVSQYGQITKDIVVHEASGRYPTSRNRPTAMSCVIDMKTGRSYIGESGHKAQRIHPVLEARMPKSSLTSWPVDNCAEFQAVNAALNAGADIHDLVGSTITTRTKADFPRCPNCKITLQGIAFFTD